MNWPNAISISRIVLVAPLTWMMCHVDDPAARRGTFVLGFLMGVSDWLDGWLARRLNQQSALGEKLDPIGDKLMVTMGTILLAVPSLAVVGQDGERMPIPFAVAALILGKDLVTLAGALVVWGVTRRTRFPARWWGKASTVAQLLMFGVVLMYPEFPASSRPVFEGLCWVSGLFALAAGADYLWYGVRILRGDVPPIEAAGSRE